MMVWWYLSARQSPDKIADEKNEQKKSKFIEQTSLFIIINLIIIPLEQQSSCDH